MKNKITIIIFVLLQINCWSESNISFTDLGRKAVCTSDLRLRAGQSLQAETILVMKKESEVVITNIGIPFSTGGIDSVWCGVETENGTKGWCFGGYLQTGQNVNGSIITKQLWTSEEGRNMVLSPNGKYAAAINGGVLNSGGVYLYDAGSGRLLNEEHSYARISPESADFSSDSKYLYYAKDSFLYSMSMSDFSISNLGSPVDNNQYITTMTAANNGRWIVCGYHCNDDASGLLNLSTNSWTRFTDPHFMWPNSYAFSADGNYCAGSATNPGMINLWNPDTGNMIWTLKELSGYLVFSPDNKYLYSVNSNLTIIDIQSGTVERRIPLNMESGKHVWGITYTEDRNIFAVWNDTPYLYIYELETGKLIQVLYFQEKTITSASFDGNGSKLGVSFKDSTSNDLESRVYSFSISLNSAVTSEKNATVGGYDYQGFLANNFFYIDGYYGSLSFDSNGLFYISSRHIGRVSGAYSLNGNIVQLYPVDRTSSNSYAYDNLEEAINFLGVAEGYSGSTLTIDPEYANFSSIGALFNDKVCLFSSQSSPPGRIYSINGTECIKMPFRDTENHRYIAIKRNTNMHTTPSANAPLEHMMFMDSDIGIIEDRTIVFKDDVFIVRAITVTEDTRNGITAPWYLVVEWGEDDGMYTESEWVWIFGGDVTEFGQEQHNYFMEIRDRNLPDNVLSSGLPMEETF